MGVAELLEFHPGRKLTRTGRPYFLKSVALMAIYRRMQLHYTTPGVAPPSRDEEIALRVIVGAIEISIKESTNSNDREAEDEGITKKFDVAMRLALEFCQAYPAVQARWSKRDKNMALEYQNASIEDTKAAKHLQEIMMALKKAHIFSSIPRITFNLVVWHEEMVKWHSAQKVGPYSVAEEYKIEEKASVDIMLCRLIEHFATTSNPLSLAQNPQLYKVFPQSEARFDDIADPLPTDKEEEESPKIICPVFPWVVMKKAMAQSNTLHIVVNRRQAKDKKVRTHTGTVLIPEGYFNLWPFLERAWSPHPEKVVVRDFSGRLLMHDVRHPPSTGYSSQTSFSSTSTAVTPGPVPTDAIMHKKQSGNSNIRRSPQSNANPQEQVSERGKRPPSSPLAQSTSPAAEKVSADVQPSALLALPSLPTSPRGQTHEPPHSSPLRQHSQNPVPQGFNLPSPASSSRSSTPAIPGRQPYHPTPATKTPTGSEDTLVTGPSSQNPPAQDTESGSSGKATITPNANAAAPSLPSQAPVQGKKSARDKPGLDSTRNLHGRNQMETLEDEGQGKKSLLSRFGNKVSSWVFRS